MFSIPEADKLTDGTSSVPSGSGDATANNQKPMMESADPNWASLCRGGRIWIGGHNSKARFALENRLRGAVRPLVGELEAAFLTPESMDEAVYFAQKLRPRLAPSGILWIAHQAVAGKDDSDKAWMDAGWIIAKGWVPFGEWALEEGLQLSAFRPVSA